MKLDKWCFKFEALFTGLATRKCGHGTHFPFERGDRRIDLTLVSGVMVFTTAFVKYEKCIQTTTTSTSKVCPCRREGGRLHGDFCNKGKDQRTWKQEYTSWSKLEYHLTPSHLCTWAAWGGGGDDHRSTDKELETQLPKDFMISLFPSSWSIRM